MITKMFDFTKRYAFLSLRIIITRKCITRVTGKYLEFSFLMKQISSCN